MSDLSITLEALERARSQLSVSSYFDEDLFRREQELIFQHGPRYLAHELAIPETGDYYALPQEGEGRVLVRAPDGGVELLSNVCRHRLGPRAELDFGGYVLDKVHVHECDYNWKTFIEVYLEDYHVGPFHPGLGSFVTCDDLQWEFGANYSVQTVGVSNGLARPGSATYRKWHDALLRFNEGRPPRHGAIWLTYFPNIMVEWYPHVLVVSTLHPKGPQQTTNVVEFYYPEEIAAFERDLVEAEQAAYLETCVEDDEIALRMDAGRKALFERGDDEAGPYQSPMEDGMRHFHEWYRQALTPAR